MKIKIVCLFVLAVFTNSISYCQEKGGDAIVMKLDGYIVNLGGEVIFQPTEDTSVGVFETFDDNSFYIGEVGGRDRFHLGFLDFVGDSQLVNVKASDDSFYMMCHYFYCELTLSCEIWDKSESSKMQKFKKPKYKICPGNNCFYFNGCWISNRVRQITPKRREDLDAINNYYIKKDYIKPDWLQNQLKR